MRWRCGVSNYTFSRTLRKMQEESWRMYYPLLNGFNKMSWLHPSTARFSIKC